jgi:hypothetical protein
MKAFRKKKLMALTVLAFSSNIFAGTVELYPTKANSKTFLDTYCKGYINGFKISKEKTPQRLNACLLFSIAAGDQKTFDQMLEKGASTGATWVEPTTRYFAKSDIALYPFGDGTIFDERDGNQRLAGALYNYITGATNDALGVEQVSGIGLGYSAVTLSIAMGDMQSLKKLTDKDVSSALKSVDAYYRHPMLMPFISEERTWRISLKSTNLT